MIQCSKDTILFCTCTFLRVVYFELIVYKHPCIRVDKKWWAKHETMSISQLLFSLYASSNSWGTTYEATSRGIVRWRDVSKNHLYFTGTYLVRNLETWFIQTLHLQKKHKVSNALIWLPSLPGFPHHRDDFMAILKLLTS